MANIIKVEDCIGCGNCEPECLNQAISEQPGEVYAIDPEKCDECTDIGIDTSRCSVICPTEAVLQAALLVA